MVPTTWGFHFHCGTHYCNIFSIIISNTRNTTFINMDIIAIKGITNRLTPTVLYAVPLRSTLYKTAG